MFLHEDHELPPDEISREKLSLENHEKVIDKFLCFFYSLL